MKINFNTIIFDNIFKTVFLLFIAYFLFLLTKITNQIERNADVGRYQSSYPHYVIDTKTGLKK